MKSLIAILYPGNMSGAEVLREDLRSRQELRGLVNVAHLVVAVCDEQGKAHLLDDHALAKDGALAGGAWGALIGFLFLNPLLGIAVGTGLGAVIGSAGEIGISHRFMNELSTHLKPGSSALFIPLSSGAVDETLRVLEHGTGGIVLSTELKLEDEYQMEKLIDSLTEEQARNRSQV